MTVVTTSFLHLAETLPELIYEARRLFKGCKVTALIEHLEVFQIAISFLCPSLRGLENFLGKYTASDRNTDLFGTGGIAAKTLPVNSGRGGTGIR